MRIYNTVLCDVCESISENGHLVDIPLVRNTSHGIAYNICITRV